MKLDDENLLICWSTYSKTAQVCQNEKIQSQNSMLPKISWQNKKQEKKINMICICQTTLIWQN